MTSFALYAAVANANNLANPNPNSGANSKGDPFRINTKRLIVVKQVIVLNQPTSVPTSAPTPHPTPLPTSMV
jgi:hypothetical protein